MHNRKYPFPFPARAGKGGPDVATQLSEQVSDVGSKHREEEVHLHPVPEHTHAIHIPAIDALVVELGVVAERLKLMLDEMYKSRMFVDFSVQISTNIFWEVDYHDRKFLYAFDENTVTLTWNTGAAGGTITISPATWTSISLPRGTKLFASGVPDASPHNLKVRACDERMI